MIINPQLLPKIRSEAIMQAMRRYPCSLRISSFIPGHRCAHQSTVVGCHAATIGKGMSTKVADLFVAAGCAHCHDLIDGRDKRWHYLMEKYPAAVLQRMIEGLHETQMRLMMDGIIVVRDAVWIKGGEVFDFPGGARDGTY